MIQVTSQSTSRIFAMLSFGLFGQMSENIHPKTEMPMVISGALALICGGCACLSSVAAIAVEPSTQPQALEESQKQIVALPPDAAYVAVLGVWGKGNQAGAKVLLDRLTQEYPEDSRLAFFRAVCTRSRFEIAEAYPLFGKVVQLAPDSTEGMAAQAMRKLDLKTGVDAQFAVLRELITKHPNHLLLLWTIGIACRSCNFNQEGADAYEALLKRVDPGPVLVHQT